MKFQGKTYSKDEIKKYIGDVSQIGGAKPYMLTDGRADGVKAIDCNTGSGLEFTILPDRCLDIAWASYKGQSLTHISKTGIVSSKYYEETGDHWFRSWFSGLLSTCGLRNTGAECTVGGEHFGQHGRIGNIPAEGVCITETWEKDELYFEITGKMREAVFYGENLWLKRCIRFCIGEPRIRIVDKVINDGYRREPLFLLYHTNYGFPLIDENAKSSIESKGIRYFDEYAEKGAATYKELEKPAHGYVRQVFFHEIDRSEKYASVSILNNTLSDFKGLRLTWNTDELPELFQFKMMGETDYQLSFEPSNCLPMGRQAEQEEGRLKFIEPGEEKTFELEFEIL
ncbi:DUF4432 domain-containing protein [Clostridia bacterium]|nr:DUF4432 domain-containing protein [Clostridia bacterium]